MPKEKNSCTPASVGVFFYKISEFIIGDANQNEVLNK